MNAPLPKPFELIDPCARHPNYLRISVTDRCNLRCGYCMPRDLVPKLTHEDILSYEEILRVVRVAVGLGVDKIRVTGGEPLVRKGICDFLEALTRIRGLRDVSLTTNAVLLEHQLARIRDAGIRRINISLDTLKPETYRRVTGRDEFHRVWSAIQAAHGLGFHPIKINVVALAGINDDEFEALARLSLTDPFHIRFIEYMPIGNADITIGRQILIPEIRKRLEAIAPLIPVGNGASDGPAQRFRFAGAPGEIGFIGSVSHHFCAACNRLRLTANGQLRPCLLSDEQLDLRDRLRSGAGDDALKAVFLDAIRHKQTHHRVEPQRDAGIHTQMSSIGG